MQAKRFGWLFAGIVLASSPVWAGCGDGEDLALTGTLNRIFLNVAHSWSLVVSILNADAANCDLMGMMGQKTAAPFIVLAVKTNPAPRCHAGSRIQATLKLTAGLAGYVAEIEQWQCN